MAYASRSGRAHTDSSNPEAFGVCDRCGIWENFRNLHWQYEWAGTHLYNKYLLFCESCLDVPQEQLRTLILPPDPLPIQYARVEAFAAGRSRASSVDALGIRSARFVSPLSAIGDGFCF